MDNVVRHCCLCDVKIKVLIMTNLSASCQLDVCASLFHSLLSLLHAMMCLLLLSRNLHDIIVSSSCQGWESNSGCLFVKCIEMYV